MLRLLCGFALSLGSILRVVGEDPKDPKATEVAEPIPPVESVAPAEPAPPAPTIVSPAAQPPASVESVEPEKADQPTPAEHPQSKKQKNKWSEMRQWKHGDKDNIRPVIMKDWHIAAGEKVAQTAVVILGDLTVDGEVNGDAVAIMGDVVVNGRVNRNVVAINGDVHLGPKAHIDGNIVCPQGNKVIDPGAFVGGQQIGQENFEENIEAFHSWWMKALKFGRPLAIGAHLGWLWVVTAFSVAFYALLGLLFPRTVRNCGDKLITQPGFVLLAGLLAVLALPVLFVLLCLTVIGIPVALLLLPMLLLLAVLFGKAAIYGLVGRQLTGNRLHLSLAVIVGALIFIVLYLAPFVGILLSLLVALVGFGCVVLTLFSPRPPLMARAPGPVVAPAAPAMPPLVAVEPPCLPAAAMLPPAIAEVASAATLPRVGFWLRLGATLLDVILVAILVSLVGGMFHRLHVDLEEGMPLWFAIYFVVMWATKGTTIGGIVCGLKVVRIDDRPLDWSVAIVRGLGAFLSLAVAGLGFIWVAFDDDKQSWHDKIAGTTIVKVPKSTPLL